MPVEQFITTVFCIVDDLIKELLAAALRRSGFPPDFQTVRLSPWRSLVSGWVIMLISISGSIFPDIGDTCFLIFHRVQHLSNKQPIYGQSNKNFRLGSFN